MNISHKIELIPNKIGREYFAKAFGCARLAYNWGLSRWKELHEQGINRNALAIKKDFNSIKEEVFPFVYEVSKYVTQQPFIQLNLAITKFFRDLKAGVVSYPKHKKKGRDKDSFYMGGDVVEIHDGKYLKIPKLDKIKMTENLRFNGKITGAVISRHSDRYYASIQVEITEEEYKRTHKIKEITDEKIVGIDVGISSLMTMSNGIKIGNIKAFSKETKKLVRLQRQLSRKQHAKTKQDVLKGVKASNNYTKQAKKVAKKYQRISNIRKDYINKVTGVITNHFTHIALEELDVKGMLRNHKLAREISDVSFYEIKRQIIYKAENKGRNVYDVDKYYPSSKKCSNCGNIDVNLKLSTRVYRCKNCGYTIDRDLNAGINLKYEIENIIGKVLPELTPVDLTALLEDLAINHIATSKVEAGIQTFEVIDI